MTLDCFERKMSHHCIKMEFQKITDFLNKISDDKYLPRFVTKSRLKFVIIQEEITMLTQKLELKHQC